MAWFPEYDTYDAVGLAELIRKREIGASEVIATAIDRIERFNPRLNAVVCKFYEQEPPAIPSSEPGMPLYGVPFLVKDLGVHCAGFPTTAGSRYLADEVAARDSTIVTRCQAAGLIILGKTNTPEMGLSAATEPVFTGPTLNPWDPERSPGGSSGGSAVAGCAGMVPMAGANDGGGSIRIPASACGLFGLKPTRARTPVGPDLGEVWSGLTTYHAITRTVRDSAALLDATAGPAPGDPYHAPAAARPFLDEVAADPGRLRIALALEAPGGYPVHPECREAAESAARLCERLGHRVECAAPPFDLPGLLPHFRTIWGANLLANLAHFERCGRQPPQPGEIETVTRLVAEDGRRRSAQDYVEALRAFHRVGRDFAAFFESYDVVLTPTLAMPPWRLGTIDMMEPDLERFVEALFSHQAFTPQFNVTGQPAASMPLHWDADGLPIGVQFATRFGDEATLFRLCAQLERAQPWFGRRPPPIA